MSKTEDTSATVTTAMPTRRTRAAPRKPKARPSTAGDTAPDFTTGAAAATPTAT
jgi:hypothetical protein